jgi:hypothetical protein
MSIVRPHWSSSTFLLYAGGLSILLAVATSLQYLSGQYGDAAYAGWALLVLLVLLAIAFVKRGRSPIVAGLFAVSGLAAFVAFVVALWTWFGWIHSAATGSLVHGFSVSRLAVLLLSLVFAALLLRLFRFPLLTWFVCLFSWAFVTDLISNGGTWTAIVTLLYGLVLLVAGMTIDAGEGRPYGFWVHVASGLTIGGAFVYWWHSGNWHWALIAVTSLVFVAGATATGRSSWAVLGALGLAGAAEHFAVEWGRHGLPVIGGGEGTPRGWVPPLVLAALGFLYFALGLGSSRRGRE